MKKYGIILGVLAFVALAVYLNNRVNVAVKPELSPAPTADTVAAGGIVGNAETDFFNQFRTTRQDQRELEIEYLSAIISEERTDAQTLADAQEQKLSIVTNMEKEFVIEQLLISKGFEDAAVTVREGSVNIILKAQALEEKQVAQVLEIACRETGEKAKDVKISTSK